jgi:hypothetical protein
MLYDTLSTNFAVVLPLLRTTYSPAAVEEMMSDFLSVSAPVNKGARHPDHQGHCCLSHFRLTSEITICLHNNRHGRSRMNIFLCMLKNVVFMLYVVGCVIGDVVVVSDVGGLFASGWRLVFGHRIMGVFKVSVLCSFDVY